MQLTEEQILKIDSYIADTMASRKIPGVALAIIHEDKILHSRGYGSSDVKSNTPVDSKTIFNIGSCTKSITAIAILQLQEQGKFSIEDPISKYLPLKIGGDSIKIRHLLSHTSGLPNLAAMSFIISRMVGYQANWTPMVTDEDFWTYINGAGDQLIHKPGEKSFYSNAAFAMLGMLISKISGVTYDKYIQEHVLKPLGIVRGYFTRDEVKADPNRITPYLVADGNEPVPATFPYSHLSDPAGGLFLSIEDFSRYANFYTDDKFRKRIGIISDTSFQFLISIEFSNETLKQIGTFGYGFGLGKLKVGNVDLISHGGSSRVSGADFGVDMNSKIGVITMANVIFPPEIPPILNMVIPEFPEDIMGAKAFQKNLQKYTGIYATYKGFNKIKISVDSGLLKIEQHEKPVHPTLPQPILLIPDIENPQKFYRTPSAKVKMNYEFIESDGKIALQIERYLYWKQ